MPLCPKSHGTVIIGEMPRWEILKEEGGSRLECVKGLKGLSVWSLAVPYGKDVASLLSEMVALVLENSIPVKLTCARSVFSRCLYA